MNQTNGQDSQIPATQNVNSEEDIPNITPYSITRRGMEREVLWMLESSIEDPDLRAKSVLSFNRNFDKLETELYTPEELETLDVEKILTQRTRFWLSWNMKQLFDRTHGFSPLTLTHAQYVALGDDKDSHLRIPNIPYCMILILPQIKKNKSKPKLKVCPHYGLLQLSKDGTRKVVKIDYYDTK